MMEPMCDAQLCSPLPVHIRWMIRRDLAEVLAIERAAFEFPWHEEELIRCLRQRDAIGMVAEAAECVRGFTIYQLHRTRLHILDFAVAAEVRRRGVGRRLVGRLVSRLSRPPRHEITLETRETNLASQLFWRSCGFRATNILQDFYDESDEDAYLFRYHWQPPRAVAAQPARLNESGNMG